MDDEMIQNAKRIEALIDGLESDFCEGFLRGTYHAIWGDETDYSQFWARVRELNEEFKAARLGRDDRERLWTRLGDICERVKYQQRCQREHRENVLNQNRDRVRQAVHNLAVAHNFDYFGHLVGGPDLVQFWADAKEVSNVFRESKPMRAADREDLWDDFQRLCERARDLSKQKREEWASRMQENLDRWREQIVKGERAIERLQAQIEDCEGYKADAKSSEFAQQVQGWIDEKQRIIEDVERRNADLWRRIRDVEDRMP